MSIVLKANYRFNAIPIKIPMMFFGKNIKICHKIHIKPQGTQIAKIILKKNKTGGLILPDSKLNTKLQ